MDFVDIHFYTVYQGLLETVGLWPYDETTYSKIKRHCLSILYFGSICSQLAHLLINDYDINLLFKVLSCSLWSIVVFSTHVAFSLRMYYMKCLSDVMEQDWNNAENEFEYEILLRRQQRSRQFERIFSIYLYGAGLVVVIIAAFSYLLDNLMFTDIPQTHKMPIEAVYFIDQERYFIVLLTIEAILSYVSFTSGTAVTSFFMAVVLHVCGVFQISGYRLQRAFEEDFNQNKARVDLRLRKKIFAAIHIHIRAIQLVEDLKSAFLALSTVLAFLAISTVTAQLFYAMAMLLGSIIIIFLTNLCGQDLIDHSGGVFHTTYDSLWYTSPIRAQKMLLIMMQRSMKNSVFILGGIFIPSLDGFATIVSTALSYFTVLCSVR